MEAKKKVLVIGLDSAAPQLIFEQWRDELPNLKKLTERGIYGELESTIPAITCPAWMSMLTSKNPGRLGCYGFRNRKDYSYDEFFIANSRTIKEDTVWDILSRAGKKVVVIGVPQTYPPKPVNGCLITSFLTPDITCQYTYPDSLKQEIENLVGEYMIDVSNFRTDDKDDLLEQIYKMTEKRWKVARHLITTRDWEFAMLVEMGIDRIQHGFWKYFDTEHIKYQPGSKYENAVRDYYKYLDREIGELASLAGADTSIIVVSDHGAKKMDGGICINEWLIKEGYLKLKVQPEEMTQLKNEMIDWSETRAWGSGGYYGRLCLNVKGREPEGAIEQGDYEKVRDELVKKLEALTDDKGRDIGTRVYRPEDVYSECRNIPPDLIVYFGNLDWRSVGSVGVNTIHVFENDTGPDDANHSQHGIFILSETGGKKGKKVSGLQLMDIAPSILARLSVPVPEDMEGKVIK